MRGSAWIQRWLSLASTSREMSEALRPGRAAEIAQPLSDSVMPTGLCCCAHRSSVCGASIASSRSRDIRQEVGVVGERNGRLRRAGEVIAVAPHLVVFFWEFPGRFDKLPEKASAQAAPPEQAASSELLCTE